MKCACFIIAGVIVLMALWLGPLPELTGRSFAAHMALHMGVVAVAAPLLALGITRSDFDPVRRWPALFPAIPLSIVELVIVWTWHAPALHHAARIAPAGFVLEQASFFGAGLGVWLAAIGGGANLRQERAGLGIAALLFTSMHMTLLGALLALTPRALYVHHQHGEGASIAALEDQHLGGAIMLTVGGAVYLVGGLGLMTRLLHRTKPAQTEIRI